MKIITKIGKRRALRDGSYTPITQLVEHNLNAPARVKLTDYGMDVWRQTRLAEHSNRWRNRQATEADHNEFDEAFNAEVGRHHTGQGWYEFQTHQLWALFGKCFREGMAFNAELPFQTNVRYVDRSKKISRKQIPCL